MKWTKNKPASDGYYWYLPTGDERVAELTKDKVIIVKCRSSYLTLSGYHPVLNVSSFNGLWSGPVNPDDLKGSGELAKCLECGWVGTESDLIIIPVDDEADEIITDEKACPQCRSVALETS